MIIENINSELARNLSDNLGFQYVHEENWLRNFLLLYDMHSNFAEFESIHQNFDIVNDISDLGRAEKEKIVYSTLLFEYDFGEVWHALLHEIAHITLLDYFDYLYSKSKIYDIIIRLPFIGNIIYGFIRRHIETMVDIKTLDYCSPKMVIKCIEDREPASAFGWVTYDHATKKKFIKYLRKYRKELYNVWRQENG